MSWVAFSKVNEVTTYNKMEVYEYLDTKTTREVVEK